MSENIPLRLGRGVLGIWMPENPVHPCQCDMCERGRRYYRNTEALPAAEMEWMRSLYDAMLEREAAAEA